jgi:ankyrin repeat protein
MQLEDFLSSSARKPRLRTKTEVRSKLENLRNRARMRDLDEEYDRIYEENTILGLESRDHAVSAYKFLLCSVEALSLNALAGAIAVQNGGYVNDEVTSPYILEICSNFIVVLDGYVRFAHPSAIEYLESRKSTEVHEFSVETQHVQAAFSCLYWMANSYVGILECAVAISTDGETPVEISHQYPGYEECPVDLDQVLQGLQGVLCPEPSMESVSDNDITRLRAHRTYFTVYAARYWVYHVSNVSVSLREQQGLTKQMADFMSSDLYKDWYIIEAYLRRRVAYASGIDELRLYDQMSKSCGLTRIRGRVLERDEVPHPGLLIAAFGLIDLLQVSSLAEEFLSCPVNMDLATPLHLACNFGHADFVEEYLKQHSETLDINAQTKWDVSTPLHMAMESEEGNTETIVLLLKHGADMTKRGSSGGAIFHYVSYKSVAAVQRHIKHAKTLSLPYKELILMEDEYGDTALHTALRPNCEEYFAIFLGEVSDDESFRTLTTRSGDLLGESLLVKSSELCRPKSLRLLLECGISAKARTRSTKSTALHVARTVEVAEQLLKSDTTVVSARDANGMTPLLSACKDKRMKICSTLLEYGADPRAQDLNGQTALHILIKDWCKTWHVRGDPPSVETFIQKGLACSKDLDGNTALHLVGALNESSQLSAWSILTLKLVEAGEGFLSINNEGKLAAHCLFSTLAWWDPDSLYWYPQRLVSADTDDLRRVRLYKIVIHFMEELRSTEVSRGLDGENLDLLYFYCHRMVEFSGYKDETAEALIKKSQTESDHLALNHLQAQRASGWYLPMSRHTYRIDPDDGEQRCHCIKLSEEPENLESIDQCSEDESSGLLQAIWMWIRW